MFPGKVGGELLLKGLRAARDSPVQCLILSGGEGSLSWRFVSVGKEVGKSPSGPKNMEKTLDENLRCAIVNVLIPMAIRLRSQRKFSMAGPTLLKKRKSRSFYSPSEV